MGKVLGLVLAGLLAFAAGAAWAAEIEGTVKTVDSADRAFVLEDGTKIWLAEGLTADDLKEGAKVRATYEERDGKNIATSVKVAE